jgi:beta-glucanase (GH16 family)
MKYNLFIVSVLIFVQTAQSQIPVNDPAWHLQTGSSEEFDSNLDFINKWYNQYPWGPLNNGAEYNYPANLIQTGTTLKIKADTLVPSVHVSPSIYANPESLGVTYVYQGGALWSRSKVYHFGYIEISAKFPTSYYPYWPAFWLWSKDCSVPYTDEIDIAENLAENSKNGYRVGTNIHLHIPGTDCEGHDHSTSAPQTINVPFLLSSGFHKYAIEWWPDKVIWYIDDSPVRSINDPTGTSVPQHAMAVILNFAIDPWYAHLPADWTEIQNDGHSPTHFPQYFEIDYLRYYKLDSDCNNDLTICNPGSDYSNRAVERSITTGGSCSPTFYTSDNYVLRATDYVILDAGTSINANGSGSFTIEITTCPE